MALRFEKIIRKSVALTIFASSWVMRFETHSIRALMLGQKDGYPSNSNVPLVHNRRVRNVATEVDRNDSQAVGNNGWWRDRTQGQKIEGRVKDPSGHFRVLRLLVSFLGSLNHALCEMGVFLGRHCVVVPADIARVTESTSQRMDLGHCGMEWEICEIELGRENIIVLPLEVREDS
jgi:hypothetical protein